MAYDSVCINVHCPHACNDQVKASPLQFILIFSP